MAPVPSVGGDASSVPPHAGNHGRPHQTKGKDLNNNMVNSVVLTVLTLYLTSITSMNSVIEDTFMIYYCFN